MERFYKPLIIAFLSLTAAAAAITGAIVCVKADNDPNKAEKPDISEVPPVTAFDRKKAYTTYYGTFEPVAAVLEQNEYMTLHPTILSPEDSMWYVTVCGSSDGNAVMERIDSLSEEICRGLETDREKARAIAMWVGRNVAYDFDAEENGSAREVISLQSILDNNFRTTCGGFANLYAALCNSQGLYCLCMKGGSVSDGYTREELAEIPANHNWNAVAIDGEWYYADCTWITDLSYRSGEIIPAAEERSFYALMDFGEMSIEHRIDRCEYRDFNISE